MKVIDFESSSNPRSLIAQHPRNILVMCLAETGEALATTTTTTTTVMADSGTTTFSFVVSFIVIGDQYQVDSRIEGR